MTSANEQPEKRRLTSSAGKMPDVKLVGGASLVLVLILAGALIAVMRPKGGESTSTARGQLAAAPAPAQRQTPVVPTPLPTELPLSAEPSGARFPPAASLPLPTATSPAASLPLPTATPTPAPQPVAPRDIEISGSTTLRLALSGEGFDSTGRPLSFAIEPRTFTLGGDVDAATDSWCIQLGLVNEAFDLTARLDPYTEDLHVTGAIALRGGFCEVPGKDMDSVEVDLTVPTDAAAQISYNLRGKRSLFGSGVLDSDTGATVELRIANTRPE